jgi:hypothetical protein
MQLHNRILFFIGMKDDTIPEPQIDMNLPQFGNCGFWWIYAAKMYHKCGRFNMKILDWIGLYSFLCCSVAAPLLLCCRFNNSEYMFRLECINNYEYYGANVNNSEHFCSWFRDLWNRVSAARFLHKYNYELCTNILIKQNQNNLPKGIYDRKPEGNRTNRSASTQWTIDLRDI